MHEDVSRLITVELVYAVGGQTCLHTLHCAEGSSIEAVLQQECSRLKLPEFDRQNCAVGIGGECVPWNRPLADADRIEILRPLRMDPKEARRQRAHSERHQRLKKPHSTTSSS